MKRRVGAGAARYLKVRNEVNDSLIFPNSIASMKMPIDYMMNTVTSEMNPHEKPSRNPFEKQGKKVNSVVVPTLELSKTQTNMSQTIF